MTRQAVSLTFDLLNLTMAQWLLLLRGMFTKISVFLRL